MVINYSSIGFKQEHNKMIFFFFFPYLFLAFLLSIILFFHLTIHNQKKKLNLPPSPFKLPIIGNLHQLGSFPHRSLYELSKKHGPLMLMHMGLVPTLVVSSRDTAEEIMKTHDLNFSTRPFSSMAQKLLYGMDMAFAPYGEYWRQIRKMCIVELLNPKRVESFQFVREEEVMNMMEKISLSSSIGLVNLTDLIVSFTNDIVCRVAFGKKYSQERGEDGRIKSLIGELTLLMGSFYVGDFIPFLAWITRLSGLDERVKKNSKEWDNLLERIVEEHGEGKRESGNESVKDFVDVLLHVQKERTLGIPFTKDHVKSLVMDMFAGGTESSYASIEWTMAELLRHPKAMKKVQEEVRKIATGKSMVREGELLQMNYLKSVIKETFRLHPPGPLLVPRESIKNIKIHGYDIPAKTMVLVNACAIGMDPKSWDEPEKFQPERFMDGGNKSHVDFRGHDFELIPFGAGRRGCPAIHFAISSVEIALANLLHRFDWKLPDGVDLDMDEAPGLTVRKKSSLNLLATPYFT